MCILDSYSVVSSFTTMSNSRPSTLIFACIKHCLNNYTSKNPVLPESAAFIDSESLFK